jgi:GrpB-like predicted nucleotidyltransferase (UPF0157 family)
MISPEQQQWINHLSDNESVSVVPWDPTCEEKFVQIKAQIQNLLGKDHHVEHRGASSLKISGQDEIDVYVPVGPESFDQTISSLICLYGQPRSNYPLKRARFVTSLGGKHVDVFVINREDAGWTDSELFNNYLLANPSSLDEYQSLKEKFSGRSVREYYREKTEFINEILQKIKK